MISSDLHHALTKCPVCSSVLIVKYPAKVSEFITHRIWNGEPHTVDWCECRKCGLMFFDPMPTDAELARLYKGYRNEEYYAQSKRFDSQCIVETDGWKRRAHIAKLLDIFPRTLKGAETVLDYGGDKGQNIQEFFANSDKYVYEISGVDTLPGIQRADDNTTIKFDVIMCNHVLEHVADPNAVIRKILSFSHRQTLFYFEVPVEPLIVTKTLNFFSMHRCLYGLYDRLFYKNNPEGFIPTMYEHLLLFNKRSLTTLLNRNALTIIYIDDADGAISCVAVWEDYV